LRTLVRGIKTPELAIEQERQESPTVVVLFLNRSSLDVTAGSLG
jgi:hypothetical protein